MTYLSRPDRRAETEPAEERAAVYPDACGRPCWDGIERGAPPPVAPPTCMWCGRPVRKHRPDALARCEAAFQAEMNRRMAGPVRVRDMAGGGP